jgi:hypothetical protein
MRILALGGAFHANAPAEFDSFIVVLLVRPPNAPDMPKTKQARAWVGTDPLVRIGRLMPEYLKWFVEKGSLK